MKLARLALYLGGSLALLACGDREADTRAVAGDTLPAAAGEPGTAPAPPAAAGADTVQTYLVRLETGDERRVNGSAGFERAGDRTRVIVRIQDEGGGNTYQGHIHQGDRCDNPGGRVASLQPVTTGAGNDGQSISEIDMPMESVFDANHLVVYHEAGGSPGAPLLCGSIPALPPHLQR